MTKLYCPKGHELDKKDKHFCWLGRREYFIYLCGYCESEEDYLRCRPYLGMDCLTEEQLNQSEEFPCGCVITRNHRHVCMLHDTNIKGHSFKFSIPQSPKSETQNSNSVEIDDFKTEAPWFNFCNRKPEVGQEIEGTHFSDTLIYKGSYIGRSAHDEDAGVLLYKTFILYFRRWRPAQPEIQRSYESNTKELKTPIPGEDGNWAYFSENMPDWTRDLQLSCVDEAFTWYWPSYSVYKMEIPSVLVKWRYMDSKPETVREDRTVDCQHSWALLPEHSPNGELDNLYRGCITCKKVAPKENLADFIRSSPLMGLDLETVREDRTVEDHFRGVSNMVDQNSHIRENLMTECEHLWRYPNPKGISYCCKCDATKMVDQNSTIEENSLVKKQPVQSSTSSKMEAVECDHDYRVVKWGWEKVEFGFYWKVLYQCTNKCKNKKERGHFVENSNLKCGHPLSIRCSECKKGEPNFPIPDPEECSCDDSKYVFYCPKCEYERPKSQSQIAIEKVIEALDHTFNCMRVYAYGTEKKSTERLLIEQGLHRFREKLKELNK